MIYRFGGFALDRDARQLLHDGAEVHLSPKAFDLLTILVGDRARALSKTELLKRLWPSTFVEETNLAGLVAELRRALGDSATAPAFIRTVHRFGYRFVSDVVESGARPPAGSARPRPCIIFENRQYLLMEGANIVGRAPDAAIQCVAAGVSRQHARIVVSRDAVTVEDLGSKNGTYVRDERITSASLHDGDEIRLGTASLTFRVGSPMEATETVVADPRAR